MTWGRGRNRDPPGCSHSEGFDIIVAGENSKNPGRKYKKCKAAGCFIGWAGFHEQNEDDGYRLTDKRVEKRPPSPQIQKKRKRSNSDSDDEADDEQEEIKALLKLVLRRMDVLEGLVREEKRARLCDLSSKEGILSPSQNN